MNILVTNDDGIDSPGLRALAVALSRVGKVVIAAPDRQRSGAGTSVTMARGDMAATEVPSEITGIQAFAIGGTPCDCVSWGLRKVRPERIDLLVSGINLGANMGFDIPFSGTVMATLTGYFLHIPSIAVSLALRSPREEMHFDAAAHMAESLARCIAKGSMKEGVVLNVNVPNIPSEQIRGTMVTRTARLSYVSLLNSSAVSTSSSDSNPTEPAKSRFEEGTDAWAVNEGYIAITPLRFEFTHHDLLPDVSRCVQSMDCQFVVKSEIAP